MKQSASFPHVASEGTQIFLLRKVIFKFPDYIIFTSTTGKFSNGRIWSEWLMLCLEGHTGSGVSQFTG